MKTKEAEIIWDKDIEKEKFDYKEFAKGIELPKGSKWIATIIK